MPQDLELTEVKANSWAHKNTDLQHYIRWHVVQMNEYSVRNQEEFIQKKALLKPGDPMTFILEKPKVLYS